MKEHDLKTHREFFKRLLTGEKTFELRWNDREFHVGDVLRLREYSPVGGYSGREVKRVVTYMLTEKDYCGLKPNFICMGLKEAPE